jgi:putative ATP-dependent endonuclease of OLD family
VLVASCLVDEGLLRRSIGVDGWQMKLVGARLTWRKTRTEGTRQFISISMPNGGRNPIAQDKPENAEHAERLCRAMQNPFDKAEFRRLYAERDIAPEESQPKSLALAPNGNGATNLIQTYLNVVPNRRAFVEDILLAELNKIVGPDIRFDRILCLLEGTKWEIYLGEKDKGLIALSKSGSGLKTIILTLLNLHLIPHVLGKPVNGFVFAFEELENNLHPAALRRLFVYLLQFGRQSRCVFICTTHSSVAIDLLAREEDCQIIHVTHDGYEAKCQSVTSYIHQRAILDDLDVRASDLLQSNGIIWVEGPSDRTYINAWIEAASEGTVREGMHYQCAFYGGRLYTHLNSEEPDKKAEGVAILRINRNCCVVMDSDHSAEGEQIDAGKQKLLEEVAGMGGLGWVTSGRDIENYLSPATLSNLTGSPILTPVGQFEEFRNYLQDHAAKVRPKFDRSKPDFAVDVVSAGVTPDDFKMLDLEDRLSTIIARIRNWNGVSA